MRGVRIGFSYSAWGSYYICSTFWGAGLFLGLFFPLFFVYISSSYSSSKCLCFGTNKSSQDFLDFSSIIFL